MKTKSTAASLPGITCIAGGAKEGEGEGEGRKGASAKKTHIVGYSLTNVNCQQTTNQRLAEKRALCCMATFMWMNINVNGLANQNLRPRISNNVGLSCRHSLPFPPFPPLFAPLRRLLQKGWLFFMQLVSRSIPDSLCDLKFFYGVVR